MTATEAQAQTAIKKFLAVIYGDELASAAQVFLKPCSNGGYDIRIDNEPSLSFIGENPEYANRLRGYLSTAVREQSANTLYVTTGLVNGVFVLNVRPSVLSESNGVQALDMLSQIDAQNYKMVEDARARALRKIEETLMPLIPSDEPLPISFEIIHIWGKPSLNIHITGYDQALRDSGAEQEKQNASRRRLDEALEELVGDRNHLKGTVDRDYVISFYAATENAAEIFSKINQAALSA